MGMTPTEALEWAADYAERNNIFTAPKNDRGYVKDGWKEPTPADKVTLIKELAASVVDYETTPLVLATGHLLGVVRNAVKILADARTSDPVGYDLTRIRLLHEDLKRVLEDIEGAK
jgi:hypothetical protein